MSVNERFYYLPFTSSCLEECGLCDLLGCRHTGDREPQDVQRLIQKAKKAESTAIVFPSGLLNRSDAMEILKSVRQAGLRSVLQLDAGALHTPHLRGVSDLLREGMGLSFVFARQSPQLERMEELRKQAEWVSYTLVPLRGVSTLALLADLPSEIRRQIRFHILPMIERDPKRLTVREAYALLERARGKFEEIKPLPPLGHEVWDARIPEDLGLEPDFAPSFSYRIPDSKLLISVIIPSYNSGPVLKNVIRHLLAQNLPRSSFEIVVVDDGSSDGTEELIRNFVAPEAGQLNFKLIRFPRLRQRKMGDSYFRAGIARNLGVKNSGGEYLCFLDADIIVSKSHLSELLEKHRQWDVIQSVRLHLKDETQNEFVSFDSVDRLRDTYILEERYWRPFFETTRWDQLPFFWKYTCTYALSLKAKHFKEAGWFRRTFVYYGFEDTDLGYRLAERGRSFYMNPSVTYHLSQGKERSEYRNSNFERQLLLSKTAKIFYLNNLNPAIYEHFRNFMGGEWSLPLWWRRRNG